MAMLETIPFIIFPKENGTLIHEVSKEEIQKAIWDLARDKTPGLDGFTTYL